MTTYRRTWYSFAMQCKLQIASVCLLLSSCAYMQTHKNVEEANTHYEGQVLSTDTVGLYRSGSKWYLSAQSAKFRLEYPTVHDEVFRKNNSEPTFKLLSINEGRIYHPISAHAAEILQRRDGYFELNGLAQEVQTTPGEWQTTLPGAQRYGIAADISGTHKYYIEQKRIPQEIPQADKILGMLDFIVVDIPGTVVYNVAIPFMAPFVFFSEFSKND